MGMTPFDAVCFYLHRVLYYSISKIKLQNNTETVHREATYIILFLTRYNKSINDNKNGDLYTSSRVSLARVSFCWWRHIRLLMTLQWSDNCDAITWIERSNLLGRSCKKHLISNFQDMRTCLLSRKRIHIKQLRIIAQRSKLTFGMALYHSIPFIPLAKIGMILLRRSLVNRNIPCGSPILTCQQMLPPHMSLQ